MGKVGTLTLALDADTTDAAVASLRSVFDAIQTSRSALELIIDTFPCVVEAGDDDGVDLTGDGVDLFLREAIDPTATGTSELLSFRMLPVERYSKLVFAIADVGNLDIAVSHGWPVLSVSATVANVSDLASAGNVENRVSKQ